MRRIGSTQRKTSRDKAKRRNGRRKARERVSRDRRIVELVQGKPFPYEPWIMGWICEQNGKRSRSMTQAEADQVLDQARARVAAKAS